MNSLDIISTDKLIKFLTTAYDIFPVYLVYNFNIGGPPMDYGLSG